MQCLQELDSGMVDLLKDILPRNYDYHVCSFELLEEKQFKSIFRIAIHTKEMALIWKNDLEKSSQSIFRILKTFPDSGLKNDMKILFRCQHKLRPNKSHGFTKNTDCPVSMCLTLKRTLLGRKSRSKDIHLPRFPCIVDLRYNHNHKLSKQLVFKAFNGKQKRNNIDDENGIYLKNVDFNLCKNKIFKDGLILSKHDLVELMNINKIKMKFEFTIDQSLTKYDKENMIKHIKSTPQINMENKLLPITFNKELLYTNNAEKQNVQDICFRQKNDNNECKNQSNIEFDLQLKSSNKLDDQIKYNSMHNEDYINFINLTLSPYSNLNLDDDDNISLWNFSDNLNSLTNDFNGKSMIADEDDITGAFSDSENYNYFYNLYLDGNEKLLTDILS
ncbi:uncharacterized protein LOC135927947 isoform X2 [Gordionus sp. m RMFG-2023]|uniref:uncharacterized protein LOC135927947 isoform X2 n=1 Tax=Gordionus sp. m RMFG-2023 TaxID=3053472 RepID=UPI0031FC8BE8